MRCDAMRKYYDINRRDGRFQSIVWKMCVSVANESMSHVWAAADWFIYSPMQWTKKSYNLCFCLAMKIWEWNILRWRKLKEQIKKIDGNFCCCKFCQKKIVCKLFTSTNGNLEIEGVNNKTLKWRKSYMSGNRWKRDSCILVLFTLDLVLFFFYFEWIRKKNDIFISELALIFFLFYFFYRWKKNKTKWKLF